jgi:hypothetical protein
MALTGCSISSATKWSSGLIPVSRKAYDALVQVETAIENKVEWMIQEYEADLEASKGMDLPAYDTDSEWPYGDSSYEIAACRARTILEQTTEKPVRLVGRPA